MKNHKEIESLIIRLMEGEDINSDEAHTLKEWLIGNPDRGNEFFELSELWSKLDTLREVDTDTLEQKWKQTSSETLRRRRLQSIVMLVSRYAAIFILGAALAAGILLVRNNQANENFFSQVIEVPFGAKSTVKLSDGSKVILNAGSTLRYDTRFGTDSRMVSLSGEAYFEVGTDAQKPFIVKTPDLTVKAYGTTFNVKSYDEEYTAEATLVEGSIAVLLNNRGAHNKKELFLKPNEQLIVNKSPQPIENKVSVSGSPSQSQKPSALNSRINKLIISKNIEPELYTSWINDRINVKGSSLKELAIKLERKYNVNITIEDKELQLLKFTGILENETIEQVMHALELSAPVKFKIVEREIWLYKKNTY